MLKNILNLDGVQQLSSNEQKSINGGIVVASPCHKGSYVAPYCCINGQHDICGWG